MIHRILLIISYLLKITIREAKLSYLNSLLELSQSNPSLAGDLWSGINMVIGRQKKREGGINSNWIL